MEVALVIYRLVILQKVIKEIATKAIMTDKRVIQGSNKDVSGTNCNKTFYD